MIRQFVDTSTGTGGIVVAGSGSDFDDIVGARTSVDAPRVVAEPQRPVVRPVRRRGGRRPALAAIAALAVAGITIGAGLVVAAHLAGRDALAAADAALASDTAAPAEIATSPTAVFGGAASLGDDVAITVSDPIAFSPSASATGADAGVDVVSTVTVTNLGSAAIDPSISLAALGTTATRVFDADQGIRINSVLSLDGGESITYRVAYAVGDVSELSLQVTDADGDVVVYGS